MKWTTIISTGENETRNKCEKTKMLNAAYPKNEIL